MEDAAQQIAAEVIDLLTLRPLDGATVRQGYPGPLMKSPYAFKQYGQSGKWVSDLFPNIGGIVDELASSPEEMLAVALAIVQRWYSARIGEGLIYDLRTVNGSASISGASLALIVAIEP